MTTTLSPVQIRGTEIGVRYADRILKALKRTDPKLWPQLVGAECKVCACAGMSEGLQIAREAYSA